MLDTVIWSIVIISTYLLNKILDTKVVLILLLSTSLICSVPFMTNLSISNDIILLCGTLGVSACLNSLSILTYQYISDSVPQYMLPMVIGIVNFGSNVMQIISPQAAELKAPTPIIIFIVSTVFTLMMVVVIMRGVQSK